MKIIATILAGGLLAVPCFGKEYVLYKKGYVPPAGTQMETSSSDSFKDMEMKLDFHGQLMQGSMSRSSSKLSKIEVLSATQFKYQRTKVDTKSTVTMNGATKDSPEKLDVLVGVPLVLELKGDTWSVKGDGVELNDEQKKEAQEIAEDAFDSGAMYGAKPRKVGETWKADKAELKKLMDGNAVSKGDVTLKLEEIVEKDGLECARITMQLDIAAKDQEEGFNMELKGTATVYRSLVYFEDIHADFNATMSMNGDVGEGVSMEVMGKGIFNYTTKITK